MTWYHVAGWALSFTLIALSTRAVWEAWRDGLHRCPMCTDGHRIVAGGLGRPDTVETEPPEQGGAPGPGFVKLAGPYRYPWEDE